MPIRPRPGPDACPGALQVHPAADGGLARVRVPGGLLSAGQFAALADACADLGDGHLELTSRGNIQLRGLPPGAEAALSERLRVAGLLPSDTHERVRNIAASVLTGRDDLGRLDVRPLVAELDARLCADPDLARLSGRFFFTIDDGRGDVSALRGDVGLYALAPDRLALVLAGTDTGLRTPAAEAITLVLSAAHAFLRARTSEWRLTELPVEKVAADLPGRRADPISVPATPRRPPLGEIRQRNGGRALSCLVPLGRLGPEPLARLRGAKEIIITPWRGVIIPNLPNDFDGSGLATGPGSGWEGLTTCAGKPGCASALADVRADATAARQRMSDPPGRILKRGLPPGRDKSDELPVHWSGCERECGHPAERYVAVVATGEEYEVRVDGGTRSRCHDLEKTAEAVAATRRIE